MISLFKSPQMCSERSEQCAVQIRSQCDLTLAAAVAEAVGTRQKITICEISAGKFKNWLYYTRRMRRSNMTQKMESPSAGKKKKRILHNVDWRGWGK